MLALALGAMWLEISRLQYLEEAYLRGDMLERRRKLMEAWAKHCTTSTGGAVVVSMGTKGVR